ncbi:MAG: HEAT repeat domain-containing protein [Planctomycetota bacterium]
MLAPIAALPLLGTSASAAPWVGKAALATAATLAVVVSGTLAWQHGTRADRTAQERATRHTPHATRTVPHDRPHASDAIVTRSRELNLLLYHLRHGSYPKRRESLSLLLELGPKAAPAIPELYELLTDEADRWGHLRPGLGLLLARLLPDSEPSIQRLAHHDRKHAKQAAIQALGFAGTIDALILLDDLCNDEERSVRFEALRAIARTGALGAPLVAKRVAMASEDEPMSALKDALALSGRHCVPHLIDLLSDVDPGVRERASWALLRTGLHARSAEEEVRRHLADPQFGERGHLIDLAVTLGWLDTTGLLEFVGAGSPHEQLAAIQQLEKNPSVEFQDRLRRELSSKHESVRWAAADILANTTAHREEALEALYVHALEPKYESWGWRLVKALKTAPDEIRAAWVDRVGNAWRENRKLLWAPSALLVLGDPGLDVLRSDTDHIHPGMLTPFAIAMLKSRRHRGAGLELARLILQGKGVWFLHRAKSEGVSLSGLEEDLRAMLNRGVSAAIRPLLELEGERALAAVEAFMREHPGGRTRPNLELIRKLGGKEFELPQEPTPEERRARYRQRLDGHNTWHRWNAAIGLHELGEGWSAARALLDEQWLYPDELEHLVPALEEVKTNRAEPLQDLQRLLEHPDDAVRWEATEIACAWLREEPSVRPLLEARASSVEPDLQIRLLAEQALD